MAVFVAVVNIEGKYLQRGGNLKREMERDVSGQKAVSSIKGCMELV